LSRPALGPTQPPVEWVQGLLSRRALGPTQPPVKLVQGLLSRPALGPTQPPVKLVQGLSGVKSGRGVALTPHLLEVPWSRKCTAVLPLWAVRPVQSLSACTRVHFTYYLIVSNVGERVNLRGKRGGSYSEEFWQYLKACCWAGWRNLEKIKVENSISPIGSTLYQCFPTEGPRPGIGPWNQLYRAARGSPGICHFSFLSNFHE
jgi:hypothetical protein